MAPWLAKLYAKGCVENSQLKPPKLYVGLAFLSAEDVRRHGATVVDSREEYLGHADIRNGILQPAGEALPPHLMKTLNERTKAIAQSAKFVRDPKPTSILWTGSE